MKQTLVILRVRDDEDGREWYDALGLPAPWRWNEAGLAADIGSTTNLPSFPPSASVHVSVEVEAEVSS